MKLSGRVALVTGAGSGMGRAISVLFAEEGAHVYVTDLDIEGAEETRRQIIQQGGEATVRSLDVTDRSAVASTIADIEDAFGVLHVLCNHVGMPCPTGLDVEDDVWRRITDVNMKSGLDLTNAALPLLRRAGGKGSIVFTGSTAGLVGSANSPLYSMMKGGVVNFVRALALSLAPEQIRVNAVCPGPVDTPMLPNFFPKAADGDQQALVDNYLKTGIPMGRAGQVREIATAALFLACDDSSFVTGVPLPVDGGLVAK